MLSRWAASYATLALRLTNFGRFYSAALSVCPTLRVKLHGRGPRAEADAARRLPHVSRRVCRRRDAVILVS
jgi:hypothetical protein